MVQKVANDLGLVLPLNLPNANNTYVFLDVGVNETSYSNFAQIKPPLDSVTPSPTYFNDGPGGDPARGIIPLPYFPFFTACKRFEFSVADSSTTGNTFEGSPSTFPSSSQYQIQHLARLPTLLFQSAISKSGLLAAATGAIS